MMEILSEHLHTLHKHLKKAGRSYIEETTYVRGSSLQNVAIMPQFPVRFYFERMVMEPVRLSGPEKFFFANGNMYM
jgi:uncharacterized membrane protein